jgi:hypothetical protein
VVEVRVSVAALFGSIGNPTRQIGNRRDIEAGLDEPESLEIQTRIFNCKSDRQTMR